MPIKIENVQKFKKKMLPFEPPRSGCSKTHYWSPTVRRNDQSISEADLIKPFKAVITRI